MTPADEGICDGIGIHREAVVVIAFTLADIAHATADTPLAVGRIDRQIMCQIETGRVERRIRQTIALGAFGILQHFGIGVGIAEQQGCAVRQGPFEAEFQALRAGFTDGASHTIVSDCDVFLADLVKRHGGRQTRIPLTLVADLVALAELGVEALAAVTVAAVRHEGFAVADVGGAGIVDAIEQIRGRQEQIVAVIGVGHEVLALPALLIEPGVAPAKAQNPLVGQIPAVADIDPDGLGLVETIAARGIDVVGGHLGQLAVVHVSDGGDRDGIAEIALIQIVASGLVIGTDDQLVTLPRDLDIAHGVQRRVVLAAIIALVLFGAHGHIAAVADVGDIGARVTVLATRPAVGQLHVPVVGDFLLPPGIDGLVMAIDAVPGLIETRATRDVGGAAVVEDGATVDIQLVVLVLVADLGTTVLAFPTQ